METQRVHGGFTLLEMVIVMAVVAIIATVAIPAMKDVTTKNSMVTDVNRLTVALNFARSEAIKRGSYVVVCKSAASSSCSPTGTADCCASSGDWTQGWLVFEDVDNDKAMIGANGDELLRIGDPLSGVTSLVGSGNAANWVSYNRYGVTLENSTDDIKTCPSPLSGVVYGRTFSVTGVVSNGGSYTCP